MKRDVYWCHVVNEPVFLVYDGDRVRCPLCGWGDDGLTEAFLADHTFAGTVVKPRRET